MPSWCDTVTLSLSLSLPLSLSPLSLCALLSLARPGLILPVIFLLASEESRSVFVLLVLLSCRKG
jgi:hypothetical protein